jgi:predicted permease
MTIWARCRSWFSGLFRRGRVEREMEVELRFHVDAYTADLIARGVPPAEAQRRARAEFGSLEQAKDNCRDARGITILSSFVQDVRYGLRAWRRNPAFTATAIFTLALGIGANATIFSWVQTILLNPLPGAVDADRVMTLEMLTPSREPTETSYLDFVDFRDHLATMEAMSVAQPLALAVGSDTAVERVWGEVLSGNAFDLLRVQPEVGRFFAGPERDDVQNAHAVAVISHDYWKSHYRDGEPVVGTTLRINRQLFSIIGVAPAGFHGTMPGLTFHLWVPATMYGSLTATGDWMLKDRKTRMFRVLARLAPGVTLERARAELTSLAARMAELDADTNAGMSATLLPFWLSHYGLQDRSRAPLIVLMGASGVVLLIVCANVANLLLARATSRRREFAVRIALGAARGRLVRQLLTEVLLLTMVAAVGALVLAMWLAGSLRWLLPAAALPTLLAPPIDFGVLVFTAGLSFLTAALAGVAPAFAASRSTASAALNEGGRSAGPGVESARLRGLLVASEVALAAVALVSAGLFLKNFFLARTIGPGFDPGHVTVARLNLSPAGFDAMEADVFSRSLRAQLEALPGVTNVTYADYVPLSVSRGSWEDLEIKGYVPGPSENMKIYRNLVAPGYFDLMKIGIVEGRDFAMQDDFTHGRVMIVNREFVRRFLLGGSAIGHEVHGWGRWFQIIGVVENSKEYRLTEAPAPYFYVPIRQVYRPEMGLAFFVRTSGAAEDSVTALTREARAANPVVPVFDAMPMTDAIGQSLFDERISASLLGVLASVAVLLAAVGLYGVMSYGVTQRTQEIGIRLTLGAQPWDVMRLVVGQGLRLTIVGLMAGSLLAFVLGRTMSALLPTVSPADGSIYLLATAFIVAMALAATALPARRAMQVDPTIATR